MADFIGKVPTNCQICNAPITNQFVDGRIQGTGQWAYMCVHCQRSEGVGLGTGKGQLYQLTQNKDVERGQKWVKIEG